MRILILDSNLLWTERLRKSASSLGHDVVVNAPGAKVDVADVAIVNLSYPSTTQDVANLKEAGCYVIGHAGHKEKDLLAAGREAGCDRIASNSELTYKLESLLEAAAKVS